MLKNKTHKYNINNKYFSRKNKTRRHSKHYSATNYNCYRSNNKLFCPKLTPTQYKMLYLIKQLEKMPNYSKVILKHRHKWNKIKEYYADITKLERNSPDFKTKQNIIENKIIHILEQLKNILRTGTRTHSSHRTSHSHKN